MSTSAMHTYLAICPDFEQSNRMQVREQHLADAAKSFHAGTLIEAGAIFSEDKAKNSPDTKMTGSWMFFKAENMEKAREWLENDIYTKGKAWDPEKFIIYSVARASH